MSITEQITELKQDYDDVYEAGKKQAELEFWNMMTVNGTRGYYTNAFRNWGWKVANPLVKIRPTEQYYSMLSYNPNLETIIPDNFDFSATPDIQTNSTSAYYHTFSNNPKLKAIPDMDMPPRGMSYTFYLCPVLERIEKVRVQENTVFEAPFQACYGLKYVRFEGTIGNTINFRYSSQLDKGSIENIIGCLSSNVSGKTITFNIDAVNKAFETSEGANNGSTSAEWSALMTNKPSGWTISLGTV